MFENTFQFQDRFTGQKDYFTTERRPSDLEDKAVNFIPNVYAVQLNKYPGRGVGFSQRNKRIAAAAVSACRFVRIAIDHQAIKHGVMQAANLVFNAKTARSPSGSMISLKLN